MEASWWLDWGALPDRLIWARLQVAEDGSAVVLDMDGVYHRFPDRPAARLWLNEDEYSQLAHLVEDGEVGPDVSSPSALSDRELVPLMCVQQRHAEPGAAPDRRGMTAFRDVWLTQPRRPVSWVVRRRRPRVAEAAAIISGWKRRLVTLAETPEYVFRDTPRHLIEQRHQRLTTFVGYTEPEVAAVEARLGVRFPAVFREYLREMAQSPGDLFRGSHLAGITEFEEFRADALELLAETDPALTLPPKAVVFLSHQGYTFVYLLAAGGFDGPPMQWTETEREPRQVAAGFADMVNAELRLMESNNRAFREQGGYYLTLHPEGGSTRSHPALASGERPLDQVPPGKPWWRFW